MVMQPHLELHFALPGTVFTTLAKDKSSRLTDYLHRLLAERAWGHVDRHGEWEWSGEPPAYSRPDDDALSYIEYAEQRYKGRELRQKLQCFTDFDHPGGMLALELAPLLESLLLPPQLAGSTEAARAGLSSDFCQLLPSFFDLLEHLQCEGREFTVVLRGFDKEELAAATQEFNAFCSGSHPMYKGTRLPHRIKQTVDASSPHKDVTTGTAQRLREAVGTETAVSDCYPHPNPNPEGGQHH